MSSPDGLVNKIMKMKRNYDSKPISYYFHLIIEKIISRFNIIFERKHKPSLPITFDEYYLELSKGIIKNLVKNKDGIMYSTRMNNKGLPIVISQARLIVTLCDGYHLDSIYFKNKHLISELCFFLLSMQQPDGLFLFNKTYWMRQDEGIASVWAAIALIKAYDLTQNRDFLQGAISTWDGMYKYMYSKKQSLLHTKEQTWWTLNVAVLFAYCGTMLLRYDDRSDIRDTISNSVELIVTNIATDGHFPYNEKWTDVYILLYHSHVMYFLNLIALSAITSNKQRDLIEISLKEARKYLLSQKGDECLFKETSREEYSSYIITLVTSLAALKNHMSNKDINRTLSNILEHYDDGKFYLFKDKRRRLTNKDLYKYNDVLLVEISYWLTQYRL